VELPGKLEFMFQVPCNTSSWMEAGGFSLIDDIITKCVHTVKELHAAGCWLLQSLSHGNPKLSHDHITI